MVAKQINKTNLNFQIRLFAGNDAFMVYCWSKNIYLSFSKLASGRNPINPAIRLVPRAGSFFTILPANLGRIVGNLDYEIVKHGFNIRHGKYYLYKFNVGYIIGYSIEAEQFTKHIGIFYSYWPSNGDQFNIVTAFPF